MGPTIQDQDTYADILKKAVYLNPKTKQKSTIKQKYCNKNEGVGPKSKQTADTAFNWVTLSESDSEIQQADKEKTDKLNNKK